MSNPDLRAGLRRTPLWKEITVILVIKAAALCLIWLAFFSAPDVKPLDSRETAHSLLPPVSPSLSAPSQPESPP